eukprot:PhF_6_TR39691/c0_g1_i1/m.58997
MMKKQMMFSASTSATNSPRRFPTSTLSDRSGGTSGSGSGAIPGPGPHTTPHSKDHTTHQHQGLCTHCNHRSEPSPSNNNNSNPQDITHAGTFTAKEYITHAVSADPLEKIVWTAESGGVIRGRSAVTGNVVSLSPSRDVIRLRKHVEVSCMGRIREHVWVGCTDATINVFAVDGTQVGEFTICDFPAWSVAEHCGSVCVGCGDGNIYRVDSRTFTLESIMKGHTAAVRCLAVVANKGHAVLSASEDTTVRVWERDCVTSRLTLTGHTAAVLCVVYVEPNVWTSSADGTIRCWNPWPQTGAPVNLKTLRQHKGPVPCLLHNQGEVKVWSVGHDGRVLTWDPQTFLPLQELPQQDAPVTCAVPVGQCTAWRIWTGSSDGNVNAWLSQQDLTMNTAQMKDSIAQLHNEVQQLRSEKIDLQQALAAQEFRSFSDDQVTEFLRQKKLEKDQAVADLQVKLTSEETARRIQEDTNAALMKEVKALNDALLSAENMLASKMANQSVTPINAASMYHNNTITMNTAMAASPSSYSGRPQSPSPPRSSPPQQIETSSAADGEIRMLQQRLASMKMDYERLLREKDTELEILTQTSVRRSQTVDTAPSVLNIVVSDSELSNELKEVTDRLRIRTTQHQHLQHLVDRQQETINRLQRDTADLRMKLAIAEENSSNVMTNNSNTVSPLRHRSSQFTSVDRIKELTEEVLRLRRELEVVKGREHIRVLREDYEAELQQAQSRLKSRDSELASLRVELEYHKNTSADSNTQMQNMRFQLQEIREQKLALELKIRRLESSNSIPTIQTNGSVLRIRANSPSP